MQSKYRFCDSISRAGVGLTLVFIRRIMRGQAWMHIGLPVACFSSPIKFFLTLIFSLPSIFEIFPFCFYIQILYSIIVGLTALLSISRDGNGHIVPMSLWCSLRQSPSVKCKPFVIFFKNHRGVEKNVQILRMVVLWLPDAGENLPS